MITSFKITIKHPQQTTRETIRPKDLRNILYREIPYAKRVIVKIEKERTQPPHNSKRR